MAGKYPGPTSVIKLHTRLAMYGVWEVDKPEPLTYKGEMDKFDN